MGFPRDFLRESQRDVMAGQRPAPLGKGGFPEGNPKENPYLPNIDKNNIIYRIGLVFSVTHIKF